MELMELESQNSPQTATRKPKTMAESVEQEPMNVKIEVICDQIEKTPPIVGYFPSGYKLPENYSLKETSGEDDGLSPSSMAPAVRFYRNVRRIKVEEGEERESSERMELAVSPRGSDVESHRNAQRSKAEKREKWKISERMELVVSPRGSDVESYRNAQRSKDEKREKWKILERMELVVSPGGSNVEFVGRSYKGEAEAAQLCTYALGVLDKERRTLKVIKAIAGNKIFRMEPKIRVLDNSDKDQAIVEIEQDKMKLLQESFGTKRVIKQIKKSELMKEVEDIPIPIRDDAVINKEALNSANIYDIRNIPPHNASATSPQEAYPLDKIILSGEWDYLENVLSVFQEGSVVDIGAYPTFVLNRIHRLQEIQNKERKQKISCILSFITHLIKFKDMHSIDGHFYAKNHNFPNILRQRFAQLFGLTSRVLAIEKIDLLISYVLVLTLFVDDFQTNPVDIAKDLRFSSVNLRVHFKNLGCKFVRKNHEFLATLTLPLTFPTFKRRRPR